MAGKRLKKVELAGKKALRKALAATLPRPRITREPAAATVEKILVIRQDSRIGNLVMLTPLFDALRLAFPAAIPDVLVSDAFPEVFEGLGTVGEVIAAPKKAFLGNPARFVSFFRKLRARRYDIAIDASHMHDFSLSSAAAARMSGAAFTIGWARGEAESYLSRVVAPLGPGTHEMDIHVELARALAPLSGIARRGTLAPRWAVSAEEASRAVARWSGWKADPRRSVAIFLGGRGAKKWPASRFVEVADAVESRGMTPMLFGGPAEAAELAALRSEARRHVADAMPLRDFAASIAQAALVVTADTGPMHIAVAVGAPTIEIFTNSEPERYGYAHLPSHTVVGRKGVEVGVDEVVRAIDARLRSAQERHP